MVGGAQIIYYFILTFSLNIPIVYRIKQFVVIVLLLFVGMLFVFKPLLDAQACLICMA